MSKKTAGGVFEWAIGSVLNRPNKKYCPECEHQVQTWVGKMDDGTTEVRCRYCRRAIRKEVELADEQKKLLRGMGEPVPATERHGRYPRPARIFAYLGELANRIYQFRSKRN